MLLSDEYRKFQYVSDVYVLLEAMALRKAAKTFVGSAAERAAVLAKGVAARKVRVVRRGFDAETFYHESRAARPSKERMVKIICVGSIKPQKNLELLAPVLQKLRSSGLDASATVVGENRRFVKAEYARYYASLKKSASRTGVGGAVTFTGAKTPSEIRAMIAAHDVAFFPSVSESFGKAALECVASGIPTMLNRAVSAYAEFADNGKNALHFSNSAVSAAAAIRRCAADTLLYRRLSRGGSKTHETFSWKSAVGILEDELRKMSK